MEKVQHDCVGKTNPLLEALLKKHQGGDLDAHYLAFLECFNQQLYFEAHEVLEELWLPQRGTSVDCFYKGLIQLSGAFVHIQKKRYSPAEALLVRASENLLAYAPVFQQLDVTALRERIIQWKALARSGTPVTLMDCSGPPRLELLSEKAT